LGYLKWIFGAKRWEIIDFAVAVLKRGYPEVMVGECFGCEFQGAAQPGPSTPRTQATIHYARFPGPLFQPTEQPLIAGQASPLR
jgi:hypothetical protein